MTLLHIAEISNLYKKNIDEVEFPYSKLKDKNIFYI